MQDVTKNVAVEAVDSLSKATFVASWIDLLRVIILLYVRYLVPIVFILVALLLVLFKKKGEIPVREEYKYFSYFFVVLIVLD